MLTWYIFNECNDMSIMSLILRPQPPNGDKRKDVPELWLSLCHKLRIQLDLILCATNYFTLAKRLDVVQRGQGTRKGRRQASQEGAEGQHQRHHRREKYSISGKNNLHKQQYIQIYINSIHTIQKCVMSKAGGGFQKSLLLTLSALLGQEDGLDVGQNSTLGDGDSGQQFVQLLIVADGELEMPGDDPGLLVVSGGVAS